MNINIATIIVFDKGTKKSTKNLQVFAPSSLADSSNSDVVKRGVRTLAWFVLVGWAIYPLGYMMGNGFFDGMGTDDMNILYNIADLVNKTAFGMMIWYAAKHDE